MGANAVVEHVIGGAIFLSSAFCPKVNFHSVYTEYSKTYRRWAICPHNLSLQPRQRTIV